MFNILSPRHIYICVLCYSLFIMIWEYSQVQFTKAANRFAKTVHTYAGRKSHACHACLLRKLENYAHHCADADKAYRMKSLCVLETVAEIPDDRNEYQSLQA